MDKISSFQKDHNKLMPGLYFSGTIQNVSTFDLRFCKPNENSFLSPESSHSIEHMLATTLRNSIEKENIIYFGPMGCLTGFYLLTTNLDIQQVKTILISSIEKSLKLTSVPGCEKIECGNYKMHNLEGAKMALREYLALIKNIK